jgi:hypothetical protein
MEHVVRRGRTGSTEKTNLVESMVDDGGTSNSINVIGEGLIQSIFRE